MSLQGPLRHVAVISSVPVEGYLKMSRKGRVDRAGRKGRGGVEKNEESGEGMERKGRT